MKLYNSSRNTILAEKIELAENFISRSIGLLSKQEISEDEALIIKPCCSIHTFFMKFAIDVIFVDKNNKVIAIKQNIKPNKLSPIYLKSNYVVEMKAFNTLNKIEIGDELNFSE